MLSVFLGEKAEIDSITDTVITLTVPEKPDSLTNEGKVIFLCLNESVIHSA